MRNSVQLVWMLVTLILGLMAIWPLLYMLATAFKPGSEVFASTLLSDNATLDNFAYVLTEVPFWRYLSVAFVKRAAIR